MVFLIAHWMSGGAAELCKGVVLGLVKFVLKIFGVWFLMAVSHFWLGIRVFGVDSSILFLVMVAGADFVGKAGDECILLAGLVEGYMILACLA